jgi:hypothetical protein
MEYGNSGVHARDPRQGPQAPGGWQRGAYMWAMLSCTLLTSSCAYCSFTQMRHTFPCRSSFVSDHPTLAAGNLFNMAGIAQVVPGKVAVYDGPDLIQVCIALVGTLLNRVVGRFGWLPASSHSAVVCVSKRRLGTGQLGLEFIPGSVFWENCACRVSWPFH